MKESSPARICIGDMLQLSRNFCQQGSQGDIPWRRLCQRRASPPEDIRHRSQPIVQGIGGFVWKGVQGPCRLDSSLHYRGTSIASDKAVHCLLGRRRARLKCIYSHLEGSGEHTSQMQAVWNTIFIVGSTRLVQHDRETGDDVNPQPRSPWIPSVC